MEKLKFDKEYLEIVQQVPDSLEEYQYWLGLKERKIYFNSEVDLSIVNKVVYWIMRWNEEDDKANIPVEQRKPIELYVTSNGGCMFSCFSLIDTMKASKTPIHTIGVAVCASAGSYILMAGHHRKCHKNTTVLIHDGSINVQSTNKKAKQTMKFFEDLDERVKEFVLSHTNISADLYEEKEDEEWYMFGDQAHELGIVDEIIK